MACRHAGACHASLRPACMRCAEGTWGSGDHAHVVRWSWGNTAGVASATQNLPHLRCHPTDGRSAGMNDGAPDFVCRRMVKMSVSVVDAGAFHALQAAEHDAGACRSCRVVRAFACTLCRAFPRDLLQPICRSLHAGELLREIPDMTPNRLVLVSALASALAACGGGGGGRIILQLLPVPQPVPAMPLPMSR